jgi:uncharacterized protein YwgA
MMDLEKRMGILSKIVTDSPYIGKTAIMKYMYLLQKVYKVPLGYEYSIYTYGPYASDVMGDLDHAEYLGIIDVKREVYDNGISGYSISDTEEAKDAIEREKETVDAFNDSIQSMLALFRDKTAKELELSTTIIYVYSNFVVNGWTIDEVPGDVHEIKPHFDLQTIKDEYNRLESQGILEMAI